MITDKATLKSYFNTNDKPTEAQFVDVFDSLKHVNDGGGASFVQPAGSPVTLTQNQEAIVDHAVATNEKVMVSVLEEVTGSDGLTNIQADFDLADEANYVQQNAAAGTDFVSGHVELYGTDRSAWKSVLHLDGNLTDVGSSPKTWTQQGPAAGYEASGVAGFGSWLRTWYLGGDTYIKTAAHADFAFGTGDFSIDGFLKYNGIDMAGLMAALGSAEQGVVIGFASGGYTQVRIMGSYLVNVSGPDFGAVHHIYVCRVSGVLYMYADGVKRAEVACTADITNNSENRIVYNCRVDDLRIVKGSTALGAPASFAVPSVPVSMAKDYAVNTPYWVTTKFGSDLSLTTVERVNSVVVTNTVPASTTLKAMVSFDGRATWKYASGGSLTVAPNGLSDLETLGTTVAFLQAALANYAVVETDVALDFAFSLKSSLATNSPSVDLITVNYDEKTLFQCATVGRYGSAAEYGIVRLSPTQTRIKKQTAGSARAFINVLVG